jgi:hypothetical protein
MIKTDLRLSTDAYDARLGQFLESAKAEITREGYTFPETLTVEEMQIVCLKAEIAWKSARGEITTDMQRMLRYKLNNLVFSQKMGGDSGD